MRRFLRRVRWARVGCAALGLLALGLVRETPAQGRDPLSHEEMFRRLAMPPVSVPRIEGTVLAMRWRCDAPDLALLSVGFDHRVERGFVFSVHREGRWVGELVVERVHFDSATCRVRLVITGEVVRPGDTAVRLPN